MGGYLYGFVETKYNFRDDPCNWELVLKTKPIAGAQSELREVFWKNSEKDYFPEIPKYNSFPDDISPETRATIYSFVRFGHIDLSDIEVNTEDLIYSKTGEDSMSTYGNKLWAIDLDLYKNFEHSAFYISYDQLKQIKWNQKVLESKINQIRNEMEASGYGYDPSELQNAFKLLIGNEEESRNWITDDESLELDAKEVRQLVKGEELTKGNRKLRLERRSMNEMLGESWEDIWNIIEKLGENKLRDVRIIFYWNH
ncbi:MAG: hypothetical protein R6V35_02200 [Candidatus Nanohaloarchaea archaeon]